MSGNVNYQPRKCSATNKLITAKDHAAVQLNIGHVDANGVYTGQYTTFALSGYVRAKGESDNALNRLASQHGLMKQLNDFTTQDKVGRKQ